MNTSAAKDEASSSLLNEGRSSSASFSTTASVEFGSEENIDEYKSEQLFWLRHPRVRENCKTVTAAFLLFLAGFVFLIAGIALASVQQDEENNHKAIIFFVCAAICIIPGGYHIIYIYRATRGERGYNFESIPSFK
ncbi:transmembrane protein 134-like isoform X2 [Actinia tenebrosa]|uniref:Transmembrane protein 134-like isoform X2 n=1 Tax=Actinia tenebrosa TaxID=6105 RepID=A0A6P8HIL5_ACTTE|nr:transmembrane protein 134-like isoform X2 [Actinia tenebrosa]